MNPRDESDGLLVGSRLCAGCPLLGQMLEFGASLFWPFVVVSQNVANQGITNAYPV